MFEKVSDNRRLTLVKNLQTPFVNQRMTITPFILRMVMIMRVYDLQ